MTISPGTTGLSTTDIDSQPSGAKQILLAEDEPIVLNTIQRLLRSWGYRVFSARNGREAKHG
jgi:response regulator RpfG family c-di-GMP phosphodiesterase